MKAKSVWKVLEWMRRYKLKVNIESFFQTAYFDVYKKADPRCQMCLDLFMHRGVVPQFVVIFIHRYFIAEGVIKNESESSEGKSFSSNGKKPLLYLWKGG